MYANTKPEDLTLRDLLARDRTVLANERTLLAYVRTGFGMLAGGVTLIKLFPEDRGLWVVGLGLLLVGTLVTLVGVWRFAVVNARMRRILLPPPPPGSAAELTQER